MEVPKGKFLPTVRAGEAGRIAIPEAVREMFSIRPGETPLFPTDQKRGAL